MIARDCEASALRNIICARLSVVLGDPGRVSSRPAAPSPSRCELGARTGGGRCRRPDGPMHPMAMKVFPLDTHTRERYGGSACSWRTVFQRRPRLSTGGVVRFSARTLPRCAPSERHVIVHSVRRHVGRDGFRGAAVARCGREEAHGFRLHFDFLDLAAGAAIFPLALTELAFDQNF